MSTTPVMRLTNARHAAVSVALAGTGYRLIRRDGLWVLDGPYGDIRLLWKHNGDKRELVMDYGFDQNGEPVLIAIDPVKEQ